MKRRARRKSRQDPSGIGSVLGSIITFPFVVVTSIIKIPIVAVGYLFRTSGSAIGAIVKLPFAVFGAVWRLIASSCRALLRIPVGPIVKTLYGGIASVLGAVVLAFGKLIKVRVNPQGFAAAFLILGGVVLAAAYPEFTIGVALVAAFTTLGVVWRTGQPGSVRVEADSQVGNGNGRNPNRLHIRDLNEIYSLTPREFEEFVRDLLADLGYKNLIVVGGARDLGVDILGYDATGRSVAVQCKRYAPSQRIGSLTIQTFIGMQRIQHEADTGIFATTADFTRDARSLAAQHDIWLIDGGALVALHGGR